ncbi:hypothetical protein FOMPIDRAFT_1027139 [Fomitopsis schrenkii]|uniref:Mid2 domain-containing protein n=1 Tax=Fomitopsis schrenkii TaxID=2126942 RepID=S8EK40_FOMSC|nr:hypothetical protein FOMPIDRAFT_1027139 [Fomitopsis schrenkii]
MVRSVIHSRFLLALLAALLLAPFVAAHDARALERRDISNIFSFPDSGTTSQTSTTDSKTDDKTSSTAATTTSSQTKSTQSSQANSASKTSNPPPSQTSNTASQTSTSNGSEQTSSGSTSGSTQATTSAPTSSTTQSASDFRTTSYSTKQDGGIVTVISTVPASDLASGTQPAPSQTGDSNDSSGISTGGIVGLSVAGGVALLAVVAFAIFKFSRKKYLDEYDDGEAIKWPELGTHGEGTHALPTHRTGGAGFETSSEVNLTRPDSRAGSIAPSSSAVDLYGTHQDPYAVPPLPHLNPSVGGGLQPYRDDPSATYYDPYSGPVPQTLDGEAIPMTQIPGRMGMGMGMDGRRSPGPAAAFAPPMGAPPGMRSASPAPGMGMRSASPAPNRGYGAGPGPYA